MVSMFADMTVKHVLRGIGIRSICILLAQSVDEYYLCMHAKSHVSWPDAHFRARVPHATSVTADFVLV